MRRLTVKLLVLAAILAPLQTWVGYRTQDHTFPARDHLDALCDRPVEILVFGDSVADWRAGKDLDRRSIAEMMEDSLGRGQVALLSGPAFGAELFDAFTEYAAGRDRRPKVFVVAVNLRTFSPVWDLRPEYQFREAQLRLRWGDVLGLGWAKPLSSLGVYRGFPVNSAEYRAMPVIRGDREAGTIGDFLDGTGRVAQLPPQERFFALAYEYPLKATHRKLVAFRNLARTCLRAGIRPLLYVTPVDLESADRAAGPALRAQVRRNVDLIRGELARDGVTLLDLSEAAPSSEFDWHEAPNEHLNEHGRRRVAKAVAEALR
jgi:hypothetical protein